MIIYKKHKIHAAMNGGYNVVDPNGAFLRPLGVRTIAIAKDQINRNIDYLELCQ